MSESKLPERPSMGKSMDDIIRQEQPIPAGEQVEVLLYEIKAPGEGSKESAPDRALFRVVNHPNPDYNGKIMDVPLFSNNLVILMKVSNSQFGWDETGYFETCLNLSLLATITEETFTPKGSSEKVKKNGLKFQ